MRVIVCGGRFYNDEAEVARRLGAFHAKYQITLLIHGMAPGADRLAGRWASANGIPALGIAADWHSFGAAAGPRRNAAMLEQGPDAVLTFPGGRGTKNMIDQATAAGVPVYTE